MRLTDALLRRFRPASFQWDEQPSTCCVHDAWDHERQRGPCKVVGCPCQALRHG